MTVALQHLLNKMIDNTPPDGCINIILSHSASSWELRISNCEKIRNGILKMIPAMPAFSSIYNYGDLWTVKKIIRLHGGGIIFKIPFLIFSQLLIRNSQELAECERIIFIQPSGGVLSIILFKRC